MPSSDQHFVLHANRRRPRQQPPSVDHAARLISETAHDLRSPLTTISESIRLVLEGDLGDLATEQQACLSAALNQCECVDQMVGDMTQLDRLRSGTPRAHRQWVSIAAARQSICQTLQPWTLPRNIHVTWDIQVDETILIFTDLAALRRLVVNLVNNAMRVTREGQGVSIRLQSDPHQESVRWTISDQGKGLSESELKRIESRQSTSGGGEGLGLMIARQLAAVHFSTLEMESIQNVGTDVSFRTVVGGLSSVATAWAGWRKKFNQRPPQRAIKRQSESKSWVDSPNQAPPPHLATTVSHPVAKANKRHKIELRCHQASASHRHVVSVGTVTMGATMPRQAAETFDQVLHSQMQLFEFTYRVQQRRWIWVLDADEQSLPERIESIDQVATDAIENLRIDWQPTQVLALNQKRSAAALSDFMIREELASDTATPAQDHRGGGTGASPIATSTIAAERLDQELQRLTALMKGQSRRLRFQSNRLKRSSQM